MKRARAVAMLGESYTNLAALVSDWDTLSTPERARVAYMLAQYRRCARELGVVECSMCEGTGLGIPPLLLAAVGVAGGAAFLAWRLRGLWEGSAQARDFHACVKLALERGDASNVEAARRICGRQQTPGLVWLGIGSGLVGAAWLLAPYIKTMRGATA